MVLYNITDGTMGKTYKYWESSEEKWKQNGHFHIIRK